MKLICNDCNALRVLPIERNGTKHEWYCVNVKRKTICRRVPKQPWPPKIPRPKWCPLRKDLGLATNKPVDFPSDRR